MNKELKIYGWNDFFEAQLHSLGLNEEIIPARVSVEHRKYYEVYSSLGELTVSKSGKLFHNITDFPAVGDWLAVKPVPGEDKAIIEAILPRKTKFSRKKAGTTTEEQIVAANVDIVFLVSSLNQDLNLRRIERYLTLAWDNGIMPVIVLNKTDLCDDVEQAVSDVDGIAFSTPIHAVSALKNDHIDELMKYLEGNKTVAVIGSSGVGKSTIINDICSAEKMNVSDIGLYKDKGRHTTTHRELMLVPGGGLIIDTPGMREIQLWEGAEGLSEQFDDIEQLALECKFTDCKHDGEPGCAINEALAAGIITKDRLKSYKKLLNEVKYFERKQDIKAKLSEKKKWKKISIEAKKIGKEKLGE